MADDLLVPSQEQLSAIIARLSAYVSPGFNPKGWLEVQKCDLAALLDAARHAASSRQQGREEAAKACEHAKHRRAYASYYAAVIRALPAISASPSREGGEEEVAPGALIQAALEAWRALPEDERNGERPFVMGFNAGWVEALSAHPAHSGDVEKLAREMLAAEPHDLLCPARSSTGYCRCHQRRAIDALVKALSPQPQPGEGM